MDVCSFLVTNSKATELVQPCKAPFNHPAPAAQSAPVLCVALCQQRQNVPGSQTSPDCFRVISSVT